VKNLFTGISDSLTAKNLDFLDILDIFSPFLDQ